MRYKEWLNIWLENYVKPTAKMRTSERYSQILKQHIVCKSGEEELDD